MSISPAQLSLQIAGAESTAVQRGSTPVSSPPAPTTASTTTPATSASASALSNPDLVTADLRVNKQHQFYYEFVDGTTGSVEFEIPPEALRAIGESLVLPLHGDAGASALDVKS